MPVITTRPALAVQSGFDATAESVYLPRFDQVAGRSRGTTTPGPRGGTTYSGVRVIFLGLRSLNPRSPPEPDT